MTHHHVNAIRNQNIILVWNASRCEFSYVNTRPTVSCFLLKSFHYIRRLMKRWVFSPYKSLCFECYVACVQTLPPPTPSDFYWGEGGICTQAKCYATMPMLLFRAWATCSSTSGVRLPAENLFSLFWSFCLCHCFFVLFYHIYFLAIGWFQCFYIAATCCSSAGCCDKRLIPNIETGLICY